MDVGFVEDSAELLNWEIYVDTVLEVGELLIDFLDNVLVKILYFGIVLIHDVSEVG